MTENVIFSLDEGSTEEMDNENSVRVDCPAPFDNVTVVKKNHRAAD